MPDTKETLIQAHRRSIVAVVEQSTGIKAVELASIVIAHLVDQHGAFRDDGDDGNEFLMALESLVIDGSIIEIEYTSPDMPFRIKSFLLPKGSKIRSLKSGKSSFIFTPEGEPS